LKSSETLYYKIANNANPTTATMTSANVKAKRINKATGIMRVVIQA